MNDMRGWTEDELAKLPKWAQQKVRRDQANIARAYRERDVALGSAEPGDVYASIDYYSEREVALPESNIRFHLGPDMLDVIDVRIEHGRSLADEPDATEPHLYVHGIRSVAVVPQASNTFRIFLRK